AYSHLVRKGEYPALMDSEGKVLSFPPILNGEETKVTESTKDIVIDVTGIEPHLMMKVLNVVSTSIAERSLHRTPEVVNLVGAETAGYKHSPSIEGRYVSINPEIVREILGLHLSVAEIVDILKKLGYVTDVEHGSTVKVWVPPYRVDVLTGEDVIEDVAIGYGYNSIRTEVPPPTHPGSVSPIERTSNLLRTILSGMGIQEVVNFMLTDPDVLIKVTDSPFIEVLNPKMKTYSALRNTLIASLLLTAQVNQEKVGNMESFEVGDIVVVDGSQVKSVRMLGVLLMGDYTLTEGIATFKTLCDVLGLELDLKPLSRKPFIEGRAASLVMNGEEIGIVGEVHPSVLVELGIKRPVVVGELIVDSLIRLFSH
ncbi:MAG: hypothetical protein J7L55_05230, partial [Desulfurococcales archaeon]|nr:hypothetical protein [Desulfurococcales archaeon]